MSVNFLYILASCCKTLTIDLNCILIANVSSVRICFPLNTFPKDPSPIKSIISYLFDNIFIILINILHLI